MSLEELKQDAEEFSKLLASCSRARVKNALISAKAEVEKEILTLELKAKHAAERQANGGEPKRYLTELTEFAWDQSEKFVKVFVTLNGVQTKSESEVVVNFTENSLKLLVTDLNGKDHGLTINNLLMPIEVEKSYRKIKTDMVAIYMKKQQEGKHWDTMTTIEKRLKQKKDDEFKRDSEDPQDALVNIMKKMYQSGDTKTKQMIAKAWTESQEKIHKGSAASGSELRGGIPDLDDI